MSNDNNEVKNQEVIAEENDNIEIDLDGEAEETEEVEEAKPARPAESLEAKRARLARQLKQLDKKLGVSTDKKDTNVSTPNNNLGESAFLIANGLKESDERSLAKKLAKETGKDLESLLETTYFQTELKTLREQKATANATPTGSKRSNNSAVDTVEYWIAKGELPPASEVKLRQDVVNARMKKESTGGQFYNS